MGITVENLTKNYGSQTAVDGLSFSAHPGEVLGILGPNGAGKTTTLRMISGLLKPDQGAVHYGDLNIWDQLSRAHEKVGYLPETNPLYLNMYVREALHFYGKIHRVSRKRLDDVIDLVGLTQEVHKFVYQLSKGYRQRLGLGIAILHDPEILILDEPISGLDPNQLTGIRRLIRGLAKSKTILFSSHILSEVEQVCDRLLIIHQGQLRALDSLEALRAQKNGRQVIVAEFQRPVAAQELQKMSTLEEVEFLPDFKVRLISRPGKDMRLELFEWTCSYNNALLESRVENASMESVFEKLTQ